MSLDIWTPLLTSNPSLRNKSLRARNKVTHVELLQNLCRDMLWLWPVGTDNEGNKKILFSEKKSKSKAQNKKNITATFGKSLFLTQYRMRYAICIPPNTKDPAINLTMVAYGNRQSAITFARANNSDLLWALKHFMEPGFMPSYDIFCCLMASDTQ